MFSSLERAFAPFLNGGYAVVDATLADTGEAVITSVDPLAPRLGDRFTLEKDGVSYDVAVYSLTTYMGGWSVACRAYE